MAAEGGEGGGAGAAASTAATAAATAVTSGSEREAQHYDQVAASYEAAFFYSSQHYRDWVLGHLMRHMALPDEVGPPADSRMPHGRCRLA